MRRTPAAPLRFVAAAHAVMPWAFPGYHDEAHAWLNFLDESHVRYYAELRDVRFLLRETLFTCSTRWKGTIIVRKFAEFRFFLLVQRLS